ncbi:MAG: hypothetical protein V4665_03515 [Patescibacteria group bacterium]
MSAEIAVITYNRFPYFSNGIHEILGKCVLILAETFKDKTHGCVTENDKNVQELKRYTQTLKKIIIFIGKAESQSLQIIDFFCGMFHDRKEILVFVPCHHQWPEKLHRLQFHNISTEQFDYHEDCFVTLTAPDARCKKEGRWILGEMFHFILTRDKE